MKQTPDIESVKAYWDNRPCNIRHSVLKVGTKEYFNEVESRKYFVEPRIPNFADFPKWKGKRVLEIGCGIGTDTINFARYGASVTTIDLSEESLSLARTRAKLFGLADKINFYQGNAEKISQIIPPEPYDLIYSFGVIHHSPNPGKILEQMRLYSHSGTTIKIMVYNKFSWKVLWILLLYGKGKFWKLDSLIAEYSEAQTGCPITYSYSKKDICNLLDSKGYKIKKCSVEHIFPFQIASYTQYQYRIVWYFRWIPKSVFSWLEHHLGWHLCITAVVP